MTRGNVPGMFTLHSQGKSLDDEKKCAGLMQSVIFDLQRFWLFFFCQCIDVLLVCREKKIISISRISGLLASFEVDVMVKLVFVQL